MYLSSYKTIFFVKSSVFIISMCMYNLIHSHKLILDDACEFQTILRLLITKEPLSPEFPLVSSTASHRIKICSPDRGCSSLYNPYDNKHFHKTQKHFLHSRQIKANLPVLPNFRHGHVGVFVFVRASFVSMATTQT